MPTTFHKEEPVIIKAIVSTGHPEIDRKLGGGIPVGSLVIVEGESDAGKSVLCQQLIWGSLNTNLRVILFTTENTTKSMVTQMDSLGLGMLDYLLMGWFKIFNMKASEVKAQPREMFERILETVRTADDYQLFLVDSLTPIVSQCSDEISLSYFENCKALCDEGKTIINVIHTHAFDQDILIRLRAICDAHFKLMIEKVGDKLVKTLEVAKIRGASQSTGNVLSFDVEPEVGMKIMPVSRAKA